MRIISGRCKGSVLYTLEGDNTRPTLDRVKESVFNILGNVFYEKNVLDLFAGSGALGLEALSRGAKSCDFVDMSKDAINIIKKNIDKCGMKEFSSIYQIDFKDILKRTNKKYDFVFLDPPYGKDMGIEAIKILNEITSDDCTIILETDHIDNVPDEIGFFKKYDSRKYGRIIISFFEKEGFVNGGS